MSIKSQAKNAFAQLQFVTQKLLEDAELLSLSSVYRMREDLSARALPTHEYGNEGLDLLIVAVKISTTTSAQELLEELKRLENKHHQEDHFRRSYIRTNILAFDDQLTMTPQITLPHPHLHKSPEYICLAAEVWPDYIHPVLLKSLDALSRKVANGSWGEFHAQGKSLLDSPTA